MKSFPLTPAVRKRKIALNALFKPPTLDSKVKNAGEVVEIVIS